MRHYPQWGAMKCRTVREFDAGHHDRYFDPCPFAVINMDRP
jgi:hypothetical protein